jgi:Flp pilus assembly secretin CpaC
MSVFVPRALAHLRRHVGSALLGAALAAAASTAAFANDAISVVVDQAKLVRLPAKISTLVVGNPLIADVSLQAGGTMVVTGKGYGSTNVMALDREGGVVVDRQIQVEGPRDKLVTVYRGVERESYSCTPVCQRRVTLGDTQPYFSNTLMQSGTLSAQAARVAAAPPGEPIR